MLGLEIALGRRSAAIIERGRPRSQPVGLCGVLDDLQARRRQIRVVLDEPALVELSQRSLAAVRAELDRRGWS